MITISPFRKITENIFKNELTEILCHCSPEEQSKLSAVCKKFNLIVRELHKGRAFALSMPCESITNKLRRIVFNHIPCFNDLPVSLQSVIEGYHDKFIDEGTVQLKKNTIALNFIALKPAKKGVKVEFKNGAILVGFIFKERKWVSTLNHKVQEDHQSLFDLLPHEAELDCKTKFREILLRAQNIQNAPLPSVGGYSVCKNISFLSNAVDTILS